MCPDCSSPSRFPAPRMSRSWLASWNPAPRLSRSASTCSRFSAPSVIDPLGGQSEIGVGAGLGPADAAAELVKLGEPEAVRAVHDQGVRAGDVETALDDAGGQQHVILAVVESAHPFLDLGRAHLAVGGDRLHFGHLLGKPYLEVGQIGDSRRDEEALAAAIMLAQQRLANHDRVPRRDVGADREPVDRRGLDDAQIAQSRHRHLQRARDWRRGQRKHVDVGPERFQPFLVGDPEMLLLVDDHQTEPLEVNRLGQQRMGADDNVDLSVLDAFAGLFGLGRGHEARQPPDVDRETLQALDEVGVMLAREQSRRAHQSDLLTRHRHHERGAKRDLGLAEADVAAHQPVHRLARLEVFEDVLDRSVLVVGLLIGEAVDELRIARIGLGDDAGPGRAQRRGLDELARDLADPLLHPRLAPLPRLAAEAVEGHALAVAAVARQELDILDRQIELVAARIFDRDAIVGRACRPGSGSGLRSGRRRDRRGPRGRRG